ncbi:MAG TPA: DUF4124 domain-containing protein [Gammaproteobacteria bacterium]
MKLHGILLVLCCLFSLPLRAEIYQTTDEDGNIVYTDVPPIEGAPEVKLSPINTTAAPPDLPRPSTEPGQAAAPEHKYEKLEVVAPPDNQTIFIATEAINIQVSLSPNLNRAENHRLEILWNDQVLTQNQYSHTVTETERGSYVILARVVDKNDQVLISSKPVTVHIKKPFTPP